MRTINYFIVILAWVGGLSCGNHNADNKPLRKDITQAVYASGKIYPLNNYVVNAKLPGQVQQVFVHIGDSVKAGRPLIKIKNEVSEISVNTAKNILGLAMQNADENGAFLLVLKQDVASARTKHELDSVNWVRFSNLLEQKATSRINYDQAKTQFDISRQNYQKVKSTLDNTRTKLNIELKNAQLQYEAQMANKDEYMIYSVIDGKVYDINVSEGQMLNAQVPIMEMGDTYKFEVDLSVDETDVGEVKAGQEVVYEIDAYKEKKFKGKVVEIYPKINPLNKTAKVIATLEAGENIQFYLGMTIEANIIIRETKNALVIPKLFLVDGHFVKVKNKKEPVKIQKGAEDLEYVEVISGIDEKDELEKR